MTHAGRAAMESGSCEDADFETASEGYASRFRSAAGQWMLGVQEAKTFDLLDLGTSRGERLSVLDVGGGHGQTAPALAASGFDVTVLGSSEAAISASLRIHVAAGRVRFVAGNLREPDRAGSFDVVMSYRLLAHARDLDLLIAGLCRAARRAVIVDYATTRSFNALADAFFGAKKTVEGNTRPFHVFTDERVARAFASGGFQRGRRAPQFFWPMAIHRALGSVGLSRALESPARAFGLTALFGSPVIARFDRTPE